MARKKNTIMYVVIGAVLAVLYFIYTKTKSTSSSGSTGTNGNTSSNFSTAIGAAQAGVSQALIKQGGDVVTKFLSGLFSNSGTKDLPAIGAAADSSAANQSLSPELEDLFGGENGIF